MRIWVDDREGARLVAADEARTSVLDHGLTVGDGVFETLKVADGRPFALSRHLRRLHSSCDGLRLPHPDDDRVREAVAAVLAAGTAEIGPLGRLRITWTAGVAPLGSDRGDGASTLVVAASAMRPWPASAAVVTVPWPRNDLSPLAGVKSTSYAENVVALDRARAEGASEAIFPNTRGRLCEGTGSNVFVVLDGQLLTPPLSSGCLGGITRELVLEWTDAAEAELPMSALHDAQEVFITSSTRDVHPVSRIDGIDRRVGAATLAAVAEFARRSSADIDP